MFSSPVCVFLIPFRSNKVQDSDTGDIPYKSDVYTNVPTIVSESNESSLSKQKSSLPVHERSTNITKTSNADSVNNNAYLSSDVDSHKGRLEKDKPALPDIGEAPKVKGSALEPLEVIHENTETKTVLKPLPPIVLNPRLEEPHSLSGEKINREVTGSENADIESKKHLNETDESMKGENAVEEEVIEEEGNKSKEKKKENTDIAETAERRVPQRNTPAFKTTFIFPDFV